MTEAQRIAMLEPRCGGMAVVLDTDTYNEEDDQFALAYAVRAAEAGEFRLEAVHAALFENPGISAAEGMELSYREIHRVLELIGSTAYGDRVFRGAPRRIERGQPVISPAAENLIRLAREEREGPLYVLAIGAGTNVASALLEAPDIAERITVIWLAGNSLHWPHVQEYNMAQDPCAARCILDSGVPLVLIPAYNVTAGLVTSLYELEHHLDGRSPIGTYLVDIVRRRGNDPGNRGMAWSKIVWDIAGVAYLLHPEWFMTRLVPTPILTEDFHWASDPSRPLMRICDFLQRDPIFTDVFRRLGDGEP